MLQVATLTSFRNTSIAKAVSQDEMILLDHSSKIGKFDTSELSYLRGLKDDSPKCMTKKCRKQRKQKRRRQRRRCGKNKSDRKEPLVIVGGGIGGTYLAWRLATADDSPYEPSDIHLYERTDHVSGRLLSPIIGEELCNAPGPSGDSNHLPRTELGGMRVPTNHKILSAVIEELDIEYGPWYANDDDESKVSPITNPMYARNVLGTRKDFTGDAMLPFTVAPPMNFSFIGKFPHPIMNETGYNPCDGETNKDALLTTPIGPDGQPYYTYDDMLANHVFEGEMEDLRAYTDAFSGYPISGQGHGISRQEGGMVIPDAHNYSYIRPLEGMEIIPKKLLERAEDKDVKVHLNQEVVKVVQLGKEDFLFTLHETETNTCTGITKIKFTTDARTVVNAKRVVLALPSAALKRIQFVTSKCKLHYMVNDLANDVNELSLMKLFAAWPSRWWNEVYNLDTFSPLEDPKLCPSCSTNFTTGYFTNDVVSQVFSWYPGTQSRLETVKTNAPRCEDMGVIQLYTMPKLIPKFKAAALTEEQYSCPSDGDCAVCKDDLDKEDYWYSSGISNRLRDLVSLDLSIIFRTNVTGPSTIKYRIWDAEDPVTRSTGVHFWKAGIKWWEKYKVALQPIEGENFHLIGEVFSFNQGWAEGALETAEYLVQEIIGMNGPEWLSNTNYCKSMPFYIGRRTV